MGNVRGFSSSVFMKIFFLFLITHPLFGPGIAHGAVVRETYHAHSQQLSIEVNSDRVIHFEYSTGTSVATTITTTPMIAKADMAGPTFYRTVNGGFETARARVVVDPDSLCMKLFDLRNEALLTQACPNETRNSLTLTQEQTQNIYGLGEQFHNLGVVNGDWLGKVRSPGNAFGNAMDGFGGGAVGNAQMPILYALAPGHQNYALFLDEIAALNWDFTSPLWKVSHTHSQKAGYNFKGYFILGDDLPSLRLAYMDLVGHAPVPPKKAFGLWVSEYGYRDWKEIDDHLASLRANAFPVDGFVLDLFWYGGNAHDSPDSNVGVYDWDRANFPLPELKIANYAAQEGIALMVIEESYVSRNRKFFRLLDKNNFLVKNSKSVNESAILSAWWGLGGMIDWTKDAAGSLWHDQMRKPLTDAGITFHWTDLGEPENFTNENWYGGTAQDGIAAGDGYVFHNLYNFKWLQSISDGYARHHEKLRHFIMSRSGTSGIARFGAAMWSGDIGSNLRSLSSHLNAQMQMSLSGIDYFGGDIGGFHREGLEGNLDELYTRWFAHASLFDVPVRPHTDNVKRTNATAPDRIGDVATNLFNIRQRYELTPYYYSLAHQAFISGTPLVPPLVYYFQEDPQVRLIADEKMVGPSVLVATSATAGEKVRSVYLPRGRWIDYHSGTLYESHGEWLKDVPLFQSGIFRLPVFVREGAILPKLFVDNKTQNVLGKRSDGSHDTRLTVEVFPATESSSFTVAEDDGVTEAYQQGAKALTKVRQAANLVDVEAAIGSYDGFPALRAFQVVWHAPGAARKVAQGTVKQVDRSIIEAVVFNGQALRRLPKAVFDESLEAGWYSDVPSGKVYARAIALTSQLNSFQFVAHP